MQSFASSDLGFARLLAPIMVGVLFICASSLLNEPHRRNFNAIMISVVPERLI